jgi:hypothetical protein
VYFDPRSGLAPRGVCYWASPCTVMGKAAKYMKGGLSVIH